MFQGSISNCFILNSRVLTLTSEPSEFCENQQNIVCITGITTSVFRKKTEIHIQAYHITNRKIVEQTVKFAKGGMVGTISKTSDGIIFGIWKGVFSKFPKKNVFLYLDCDDKSIELGKIACYNRFDDTTYECFIKMMGEYVKMNAEAAEKQQKLKTGAHPICVK